MGQSLNHEQSSKEYSEQTLRSVNKDYRTGGTKYYKIENLEK